MPARNQKSMEREQAREPSSLIDILEQAHWEIRCLLREMEQILDVPTAIYELYPRIRVALDVHTEAEQHALYGPLGSFPDLRELADQAEGQHQAIDELLHRLDRKPWRHQQIHSPEWKRDFRELHRLVLAHLELEETRLFHAMKERLAPSRIDALGDRYRQGLGGEVQPTAQAAG